MTRSAIKRELGKRIGKLRLAKGLSREDLARICGMMPGKMRRLEEGLVRPCGDNAGANLQEA